MDVERKYVEYFVLYLNYVRVRPCGVGTRQLIQRRSYYLNNEGIIEN